jgi:hypothetical protein
MKWRWNSDSHSMRASEPAVTLPAAPLVPAPTSATEAEPVAARGRVASRSTTAVGILAARVSAAATVRLPAERWSPSKDDAGRPVVVVGGTRVARVGWRCSMAGRGSPADPGRITIAWHPAP